MRAHGKSVSDANGERRVLGGIVSPVMVGRIKDATGSTTPALRAIGIASLVCAVIVKCQSRSLSPACGCHFINRFSTRPTSASSPSANAVSTRMPAITVLMSKLPSACRIR